MRKPQTAKGAPVVKHEDQHHIHASHIDASHIHASTVIPSLALTISSQLDVAVRVWDCFLREGEVYFIKVALGILKTLAPLLATKSDLSDVVKLLRTGEGIEVAALLENVGKIHVTKSVESGISGQPRQKSGGCKQM